MGQAATGDAGAPAAGPEAPDGPAISAAGREFVIPAFGPRSNLRDRVTEVLRGAIITGAMRPGQLYSAPTLADRFGVSATPVREAMLDLAKEGLVEAVRNKGFRVTEPTEAELDDMTALRMLIEVPTCAEIARRYTAAWSARLAELAPVAKEIVASAETGDLIAYVEADRRFHLGLLELAGNAELVAVVGQLRARSRLYGLEELVRRGELERSAAEHLELLDLVRRRDADGAANLMRRHITHVRGVWAGHQEPA